MNALQRAQRAQALVLRATLTGTYLSGPLAGQPYINVPAAVGVIRRYHAPGLPKMGTGQRWLLSAGISLGLTAGLTALAVGLWWLWTSLPYAPIPADATPLDALAHSMEAMAARVGLLMAMVGGMGVVLSKFDNPLGVFFSMYLNYFVTAGVFGGMSAVLLPLLSRLVSTMP